MAYSSNERKVLLPSLGDTILPLTSPSQNSCLCSLGCYLIPEGINDPSPKMDAISDSETQYSKACAQEVSSTGMRLSILITPFTGNLSRLNQTHMRHCCPQV